MLTAAFGDLPSVHASRQLDVRDENVDDPSPHHASASSPLAVNVWALDRVRPYRGAGAAQSGEADCNYPGSEGQAHIGYCPPGAEDRQPNRRYSARICRTAQKGRTHDCKRPLLTQNAQSIGELIGIRPHPKPGYQYMQRVIRAKAKPPNSRQGNASITRSTDQG